MNFFKLFFHSSPFFIWTVLFIALQLCVGRLLSFFFVFYQPFPLLGKKKGENGKMHTFFPQTKYVTFARFPLHFFSPFSSVLRFYVRTNRVEYFTTFLTVSRPVMTARVPRTSSTS